MADVCVKCSKNFYFGDDGFCKPVDPLCKTYDLINGNCLTCYQSYIIEGIKCVQDTENTSNDPNCASWLEGVCVSCAPSTYIGSTGLCEQVSIDCNTYDKISGACTSCYAGFGLVGRNCTIS